MITANQMMEAVQSFWPNCDCGVFSAAVADYRPLSKSEEKIKKNEDGLDIKLTKNPDILSWASASRENHQKIIGFALETNNEEEYALKKLERKKLDMIVLNSTKDDQATFGGELNKVTIFDKTQNRIELPLQTKLNIGIELINLISKEQ